MTPDVPTLVRECLASLREQRPADGAAVARQILAMAPDSFDGLHLLGLCEASLGSLDVACGLLRRALAQQPDRMDARGNLVRTLERGRRYEDVAQELRMAAAQGDEGAALAVQMATARMARKDYTAAIDILDDLVRRRPDDVVALGSLAESLAALDRLEDAERVWRPFLAREPSNAKVLDSLAGILMRQGRPGDAVEILRRAGSIAESAARCNALGLALMANRCTTEAIVAYDRALALDPGRPGLRWNRSHALLKSGDFEQGWKEYEARRELHRATRPPEPRQPSWTGQESLRGKSILLRPEQGYGDAIQFVRFAPRLAALGAEVVLQAYPALLPLLDGIDGVARLVSIEAPDPDTDYFCWLMSLPYCLGLRVETIPAEVPYLRAPADALARWESRLPPRPGMRIGLAWSGSATHVDDAARSMPLETLRPLLTLPGLQWICLQKDVRPADRVILQALPNLQPLGLAVETFADTAAIIAGLDLVISVDTSVVHLAGAMACPTWIMLPFNGEYRWLDDTTRSPWYPTARLFRQSQPGDWPGVVVAIDEALSLLDAAAP